MTSIKPPVSLPATPAAPTTSEATATDPSGEVAGQTEATAASGAAGVAATATAGAAPDAIGEIARAIGEGSLTVEQAVERLVERAIGPVVTQLSEAEREELVALLRDALAHDPALVSLRDTLR